MRKNENNAVTVNVLTDSVNLKNALNVTRFLSQSQSFGC